MANFTDTRLQPFTPYVEQLPIDAMVTVGRQKQAQYDQGIQKIQSQIDNIAGMDIIKPEHRKYLESKLNQLGGNLKKVAAGDFSNYQLTNSVGGMITQIGKDPLLQNAVKSTQYVRKGQEELEVARKAGKSSPENEYDWNTQLNSWLSNPDVNSQFAGRYVPYKDVDTKLRTIAEKLHEIDNSIDIPYQRDAGGNILMDKNNKPLVDDAMLRIKTKGKPAEKILSNFYSSLDENDKEQLRITGNYHYRNATKDTFKAELQSNYADNKKMLSDSLVSLNLDLQISPKISSAQKGEIQAKINAVNTKLTNGSLESELYDELSNIDNISNLSDYKYKLYTQKYLNNLAKDMSYQSYQQEIVNNPYTQMGMEKSRLQFQYDNANRQQRNWEADFGLNKDKFAFEQAQFFAKQAAATGASKPATPGRLPTDIDTPSLDGLGKQITDIIGDTKTGKLGQIDVLNSQYAPLITDSSMSNPAQKKAYLDGLAKQYSEGPDKMGDVLKDPNIRQYLEKRRGLEIEAAQKQALYNGTVEASKGFDNQIDKVYKNVKGVDDASGREIYTAKEVAEVKATLSRKYLNLSNVNSMSETGSSVDVRGFLNEYKGTKYEFLANTIAKRETRAPMSSEERRVLDRVDDIRNVSGAKTNEISEAKFKFQADYLAKHMPERQTMVFTLDVNNSEAKARIDERAVEAVLGDKFAEFEDLGGVDNEKFASFDPATISKFKADKEATYIIEKSFDGSANLRITSKGEQQIVPMTASEFSTFFPGYSRGNPIDNIKNAILSSPNKTTNISGNKGDAVNAYITGYSLPQLANTALAPLVRVDVEGDPFNTGSDKDGYVVRMYVNDNELWKSDVLTQKGYVNEATLQKVLQSISPKTVTDLLKKNNK